MPSLLEKTAGLFQSELVKPVLLVLGCSRRDFIAAVRLLRWMRELDEQQSGALLIVSAANLRKHETELILAEGRKSFKDFELIKPVESNEGEWPRAANHLFQTAAGYIARKWKCAFQWIEPDCVPICPGWKPKMDAEYVKMGKPFMGCIYSMPFPHLTGCAFYPPNLAKINSAVLQAREQAWDVVNPSRTIPETHHTPLFQHEWGNFKYNVAPSFPTQASMKLIRSDAVLFHRCKDGTLIDRLRERREHPAASRWLASLGNDSNLFQEFDDVITKP